MGFLLGLGGQLGEGGSGRRRRKVGMMERQVEGCRTRGREEVEMVRERRLMARTPWVACR